MSLLLTLVDAPRAQTVRQMRLRDGEQIVIGRGSEANWRIDDPDNYVSRAHCMISGRDGAYTITDTSSGGLFIDDARSPLGPGRPAPLRDGMRLRLGDYVVRVEFRAALAVPSLAPAPSSQRTPELDIDRFFQESEPEQPRPVRPRDLPDPFDPPPSFVPAIDMTPPERRGPPVLDDPFTLDPPSTERARERPAPPDFGWGTPLEAGPAPDDVSLPRPAIDGDLDLSWGPLPAPPPTPGPVPPALVSDQNTALFDAFLRGLGIIPIDVPESDRMARMEAFGREYRLMTEGLIRLLRLRAEEKGNARIAQTVVGATEVNPLKFMPSVEDALTIMVSRRSKGFAEAEVAIAGAVRDLAAHHIGTWRGTQAALQRMVDQFDPAVLEKELEALGLLEQFLAGGRRAKLWELYQKRFRAIAESAETRFLGEVGANFRDAYEGET